MSNYFYVDCEKGKDSNEGTQEKPLETVTKAIKKSSFGDTIFVSVPTTITNEDLAQANGLTFIGLHPNGC
jgi:hypothetical protein